MLHQACHSCNPMPAEIELHLLSQQSVSYCYSIQELQCWWSSKVHRSGCLGDTACTHPLSNSTPQDCWFRGETARRWPIRISSLAAPCMDPFCLSVSTHCCTPVRTPIRTYIYGAQARQVQRRNRLARFVEASEATHYCHAGDYSLRDPDLRYPKYYH